ncbi:hypothetical protein QR685DRAFT_427960, partial [Neurospora intermedia]
MLPTTDAGGGVPQSDRVPWLRISETSAPCPPNSQHRNGWCRYRGELSSPSDTAACKLLEKLSKVRTLEGRCLDVKCHIYPITSPRSICSRSSQSWGRSFVGQGGDRIGGPHAKAPASSCKWKCET